MVKIIGIIIGLLIAAFIVPIPYFIGEDIVCAPNTECPKNVWSYKPPLMKQIVKKKPGSTVQSPSPASSPTPSTDPMSTPSVRGIVPGEQITSPFTVAGTVPPGWMFEGSVPIKLVNEQRKVIVQTFAQESVGGSWQSGNPVEFSTAITFPATTGTGYLVIEKDNPSGLPENVGMYEIPVRFSN